MSFTTTLRKVPKNVKPIKFNFKDDPTFGMINLCCWEDEIDKIETKLYNQKIINTTIKIHFPIFGHPPIIDHFYVKEYSSKNGFTFKELVEKIVKAGLQTGKYYSAIEKIFQGEAKKYDSAVDFISEYSIASNERFSDINIKGNNVYISLQVKNDNLSL